MNNNNLINQFKKDIEVIDEKINLSKKYYEKQLNLQYNKQKIELEKLDSLEEQKKNKINLIKEKFDNMKKEKAHDYNELLLKKNELSEKKN